MRRLSVFAVWLAWAMPARAQAPVEADGPSHEAPAADSAARSDAPDDSTPPGESGRTQDAAGPDDPSADPSPPSRPRVGVMVLAVSPEDAALADGLGEVLLAAIARRDALRLVGKEEIQAALGHDDAASLGCIAAAACLGQLGVQLGLGELVAVTLGRRDDGFVFDLGRFDPRTGTRLAHVFREVPAEGVGPLAEALLDALEASEEEASPVLARVMLTISPAEATVRIDGREVSTAGTLELAPGEHRLEVEAEGFVGVARTLRLTAGERRDVDVALASVALPPPPSIPSVRVEERPAPWSAVAIASGGLVVASGALALAFGVRSRREVPEGLTRAEALSRVEDRRRDARVANAGMVVGSVALAGAALGAVLAIRGRREAVALVPVEGGALASIEVRR